MIQQGLNPFVQVGKVNIDGISEKASAEDLWTPAVPNSKINITTLDLPSKKISITDNTSIAVTNAKNSAPSMNGPISTAPYQDLKPASVCSERKSGQRKQGTFKPQVIAT